MEPFQLSTFESLTLPNDENLPTVLTQTPQALKITAFISPQLWKPVTPI